MKLTTLTVLAAFACITANAGIILSTPSGPIPGSPGTGLPTDFYYFNNTAPGTIDNSDAIASGMSPTVTFTTLTPAFPSEGGSTGEGNLEGFVNGNGTNFSSDFPTDHTSYFVMTGYLAVRSTGTQNFRLVSDDGSRLIIGGQVVVNDDNDHGMTDVRNTVTFTQTGLYAFQVKYFEDGGGMGLTADVDPTGGNSFGLIATSDLYGSLGTATPEPASFVLGGAALGVVAFLRRRAQA